MGFSPGTLSMASSDMNAACSGAPAANTAGTKWTVSYKPSWREAMNCILKQRTGQSVTHCEHLMWRQSLRPLTGSETFFIRILELFINLLKAGLIQHPHEQRLTWSGGWADSFQGTELCDRCLHIRQEAEGLSGTFLHSVLAVGSHQLLQSRPELPSLQKSTWGHSRTQLMHWVLLDCCCHFISVLYVHWSSVTDDLLCGIILIWCLDATYSKLPLHQFHQLWQSEMFVRSTGNDCRQLLLVPDPRNTHIRIICL